MNRWIAEIETRPGLLAHYKQHRGLVKLDRADREAASEDEVDRFFGSGRHFRV